MANTFTTPNHLVTLLTRSLNETRAEVRQLMNSSDDAVYDPNTIPLHHIICDQGRDGLCLDFKTYYYVGLDTETSDKDKKIARILEVVFASLVDKVLFSGKL